ncbi:unknown protein [Xanthomonas oryzae pv. oryzae KACC 10331]|uniref:Uncharacterized protein n=1 Tax=Xanthomonas oryzae pv. oryzae (strain KACC10331 / KXO85) TaxID=291331 RepID=Q5H5A0_XANOR|nr:unknown protein [Xanthomonas oryzae pv. oryzae KACC 10331]
MRPGDHGLATELLAVVGADHLRQATTVCQPIQHAHNAVSRDRTLHVDGDRFVGCVVHDHQAFDCPAFGGAVEHDVHGSHRVGLGGPQQRCTLAYRHLFTRAAPDLQLLLAIQPLHPLIVHETPFLPQLERDHPHAIAAMAMRQRKDALAQLNVAVLARAIAQRTGAHADRCQGAALAGATFDPLAHQRTTRRCAHHCFCSASLIRSF